MNDRSRSGLLVLRNNNGPQEALLTGCLSKLNKVFTVLDPQRFSPQSHPPPSLSLKSPQGCTASMNSSSLSLFTYRYSGGITRTAVRMQVSGSRIKLWCPLISLALIHCFAPVSAQGNCRLQQIGFALCNGSFLALCSGILASLCFCNT